MCPSSGFFRSSLVWSFLPTFGSNKDFHSALHLKEATLPDTRCLEDSLKKLSPWLIEASQAPYTGIQRLSVINWVPAFVSTHFCPALSYCSLTPGLSATSPFLAWLVQKSAMALFIFLAMRASQVLL